jgi:hypothetical protein
MPEYENEGDRGCQSCQKQAGILQSKHDGTRNLGDGIFFHSYTVANVRIVAKHAPCLHYS